MLDPVTAHCLLLMRKGETVRRERMREYGVAAHLSADRFCFGGGLKRLDGDEPPSTCLLRGLIVLEERALEAVLHEAAKEKPN